MEVQDRPPPRKAEATDLLLVRHTVKVNGQEIYAGEDFAKALRLLTLHTQSLALVRVDYIAQKQAVPVYYNPHDVVWDEV